MGVYIKGMKMPKQCYDCQLCYCEEKGCIAFCRAQLEPNDAVEGGMMWKEIDYSKIDDGCPLVEVKEPHGRLVDADALLNTSGVTISITGKENAMIVAQALDSIYQDIKDAPTVIESEETDSDVLKSQL